MTGALIERPLTVADVLTAAADLIAKPGAWTQGEAARTADGSITYSSDADAVCWCTMGAINRIAYAAEFSRFDAYPFMELVVGADVADWNDAEGRTQAEVVAALRAAAEKARTDSAVGTTEGRAPILSPETNEQTPVTHTGGA